MAAATYVGNGARAPLVPEVLSLGTCKNIEDVGVFDVAKAVLRVIAHFIAHGEVAARGDIAHPIDENPAQRIRQARPGIASKELMDDEEHASLVGDGASSIENRLKLYGIDEEAALLVVDILVALVGKLAPLDELGREEIKANLSGESDGLGQFAPVVAHENEHPACFDVREAALTAQLVEPTRVLDDAIPPCPCSDALKRLGLPGINGKLHVLNARIERSLGACFIEECAICAEAGARSRPPNRGDKIGQVGVNKGLAKTCQNDGVEVGKQRHEFFEAFRRHQPFAVALDQPGAHLAFQVAQEGGLDMDKAQMSNARRRTRAARAGVANCPLKAPLEMTTRGITLEKRSQLMPNAHF